MKLKKLLKVIPEDYKIRLTYSDNDICFSTYGTKEDAIMSLVQRTTDTPEYIKDMNVTAIHPCARTYCTDENLFGDAMPSMHIETRLLIEIMKKR